MKKNFKIMKSKKNSKKNSWKRNEKEAQIRSKVDYSFEKLFYDVIDVLAYSRFYEIGLCDSRRNELEYVIFVKSIYKNFSENRGFFKDEQLQIYQNISAIIDESCSKKFKTFMDICNSGNKNLINEEINKFINDHNIILSEIKSELEKENSCKRIENQMKVLWEKNPEIFQELIDFEIDKKELKNTSDIIKAMLENKVIKPSPIFLNEIKRHSNLEKTSLENKNRPSFCVIS